jgi:polysaccharide biosynthesis transport protein
LESGNLHAFEATRIEKTMTYVGQKQLLENLKNLPRERLRQVLPTTLADSALSTLLGQLNDAEQKLVLMKKDLGPENSAIFNVKDLVTKLNQQIDERVDGIMVGLENQVAIAKANLEALEQQVADAKKLDQEKAEKSRPYYLKKQELEEILRFRDSLYQKIQAEQIDAELPKVGMVQIIDTAKPGETPVRPNVTLNIVSGVVVGLVIGIALAFFIEYLDTSVKTIDDVERALQAPVLGVIPQNVGILLEEGAESPHAEAYRVLRTNLMFTRKDEKLNSVAVVSAGAGEGKSTTIFNLATVFAQSGHRVVIVDSDLRRPSLHKILHVNNNIGLTNYLLKQNTLEEVIQTSSLPMLDFMPSGRLPSSSLGILSSNQMKDLISELKRRYDFVFFDSPPIMGVSDASILASEVDMTIQVIQYRRYPQPMNIRAKQVVEKVGGNLIGIVLNNINVSQDESYYYYSGYYHDYYAQGEEAQPQAAPAPAEGTTGDDAKVEIKQKY